MTIDDDTVIGRIKPSPDTDYSGYSIRLSDLDEPYRTALLSPPLVPQRAIDGLVERDTRIAELEAKVEKFRLAEQSLGEAYLRLRSILGAFDTPLGPSAEEVWTHAENKAKALVARLAKAEAALEAADSWWDCVCSGCLYGEPCQHGKEVAYQQARAAMCLNGGDT